MHQNNLVGSRYRGWGFPWQPTKTALEFIISCCNSWLKSEMITWQKIIFPQCRMYILVRYRAHNCRSTWSWDQVVLHTHDTLNPFTPKSDQVKISPVASPVILHHTVWRTWLFIAYSDWKMILVPVLTTSLIHFSWKGWENSLFELGIERVKPTVGQQSYHDTLKPTVGQQSYHDTLKPTVGQQSYHIRYCNNPRATCTHQRTDVKPPTTNQREQTNLNQHQQRNLRK